MSGIEEQDPVVQVDTEVDTSVETEVKSSADWLDGVVKGAMGSLLSDPAHHRHLMAGTFPLEFLPGRCMPLRRAKRVLTHTGSYSRYQIDRAYKTYMRWLNRQKLSWYDALDDAERTKFELERMVQMATPISPLLFRFLNGVANEEEEP